MSALDDMPASAEALYELLTDHGVRTMPSARRELAESLAAAGASLAAVRILSEHARRSCPGEPEQAARALGAILGSREWRAAAADVERFRSAGGSRDPDIEPGQRDREDGTAQMRNYAECEDRRVRQAHAIAVADGFGVKHAATVMGVDTEEVHRLLEAYERAYPPPPVVERRALSLEPTS